MMIARCQSLHASGEKHRQRASADEGGRAEVLDTTRRQTKPTGMSVWNEAREELAHVQRPAREPPGEEQHCAPLRQSEGCTWIGPRLIHRRAPLTSLPMSGTSTSKHLFPQAPAPTRRGLPDLKLLCPRCL
jgi:hypothetical protein